MESWRRHITLWSCFRRPSRPSSARKVFFEGCETWVGLTEWRLGPDRDLRWAPNRDE